jgi:hypothetical protein
VEHRVFRHQDLSYFHGATMLPGKLPFAAVSASRFLAFVTRAI